MAQHRAETFPHVRLMARPARDLRFPRINFQSPRSRRLGFDWWTLIVTQARLYIKPQAYPSGHVRDRPMTQSVAIRQGMSWRTDGLTPRGLGYPFKRGFDRFHRSCLFRWTRRGLWLRLNSSTLGVARRQRTTASHLLPVHRYVRRGGDHGRR